MAKRSDTTRRPHRCKGKRQDGGAADAPVLLSEMEDQDRALVRAIRMWVASGGDRTTVGLLFGCDLGREAPEGLLTPLIALIDSMDEEGGPAIALREPSCGKTTPSERAIARMVSAMERGDAATAQACASALVSPARSRQVVAHAFVLATALAESRTISAGNCDFIGSRMMAGSALC